MEVILSDFHSIEKEYEILERTCDLMIHRALNTFYKETALEELSSSLFLEEDNFDDFDFNDEQPVQPQNNSQQNNQNTTGKKPGILQSIINTIQKFVNGFINMIKNIFGKKQNMTAEEYLKAPNTKIQLEAHIDKMADALDKEVTEGRTIIQKISSVTGVDAQQLAHFTDLGASVMKSFVLPVAVPAATAWGISKLVTKRMNGVKKNVDEIANDIKNNPDTDPKQQEQKVSVLKSLQERLKMFFGPVNKCNQDLSALEKEELKSQNNPNDNKDSKPKEEKKSFFRKKPKKEETEEDPDKKIWTRIHALENQKRNTIEPKQKKFLDSQIEEYKSRLQNKG